MFNTCIAQLNLCDFYTILELATQSESLHQTFCRLKTSCWIQTHTSALHSSWAKQMNTQLLIFTPKMGKTISKGCSNILRVMESSACYRAWMLSAASSIWVSVPLLNFMLSPLRSCVVTFSPNSDVIWDLCFLHTNLCRTSFWGWGINLKRKLHKGMSPPWDPTVVAILWYLRQQTYCCRYLHNEYLFWPFHSPWTL